MKPTYLLLALCLVSGCVGSSAWYSGKMSSTEDEAKANNKKMMALEVGQSRDTVLIVMGQPTRREAYQLDNQRIVEFLFYRTSGWSRDDRGDKDYQFTPVALEQKKLIGWGRNFYDNIVKIAVQVTGK